MNAFNAESFKRLVYGNGMTVAMLATEIGISKTAMFRKINGKSDFTRKEIISISECLGVKIETLFPIFFNQEVAEKTLLGKNTTNQTA